jgi:protein kinase A
MAAAVQKLLHHVHHDASQREPSPSPNQDPQDQAALEREREDEKRMIAQWADHQEPMSPSDIMRDEDDKMVGHSSRALRQDDFQLIKTLGTGKGPRRRVSQEHALMPLL